MLFTDLLVERSTFETLDEKEELRRMDFLELQSRREVIQLNKESDAMEKKTVRLTDNWK